MEIKNGIIIDGVLHEAVNYRKGCDCDTCSLRKECDKFEGYSNEWLCKFLIVGISLIVVK